MTRWKIEFRSWAARERLRVFTVPKEWQDWTDAKLLSRLCDHIARTNEARIEETVERTMIFSAAWDPTRW